MFMLRNVWVWRVQGGCRLQRNTLVTGPVTCLRIAACTGWKPLCPERALQSSPGRSAWWRGCSLPPGMPVSAVGSLPCSCLSGRSGDHGSCLELPMQKYTLPSCTAEPHWLRSHGTRGCFVPRFWAYCNQRYLNHA